MAVATSALLCQCLGCVSHRGLARFSYELTEVNSQYFLIPTVSQTQGLRHTVPIDLGDGKRDEESFDQNNCAIHGQWFSFYPARSARTRHWVAETPSADRWAQSAGDVDMKSQWDKFLQDILALQRRRCFPSANDFIVIKQKIVESMVMPADEALQYRYSFGPGGYVDLTPGMQLRIERNVFMKSVGGQRNGARPLGTMITYYAVTRDTGGGTHLKFIRSKDNYKKGKFDIMNLPDKTLATTFKTSTYLRLMLQGLTVSGDIKSPALLIGGSDIKNLNEATRVIVNNPKLSCNDLRNLQIPCVEFDGLVTVSPDLKVIVNGHLRYVPLGSKVRSVLPPSADTFPSTIESTLRIRRLFEGKYGDLQFGHDRQDIDQLLLLGADNISWSKSVRN